MLTSWSARIWSVRLSLESCWSHKGHGLNPLPWCASILDRCCSPIVWREPRCLTESHRAGQEPPPFTTLAMRGALEVYKSSSWVLSACRTSFLICWRHTESAPQRMESVYLRLYTPFRHFRAETKFSGHAHRVYSNNGRQGYNPRACGSWLSTTHGVRLTCAKNKESVGV